MRNLVLGVTYFRLTYADPAMTMPGVRPVVYIGTNIFPDDVVSAEATYYFQDTVSFQLHGSAADASCSGECSVFPETEADLDAIFELPGLVHELTAAVERAKKLGVLHLERWRPK
jgi:hypothetical protein